MFPLVGLLGQTTTDVFCAKTDELFDRVNDKGALPPGLRISQSRGLCENGLSIGMRMGKGSVSVTF